MAWLSPSKNNSARFNSTRFHLKSAAKAARAEPEINLIPFIDVLLVILIFLMISTTFTRFQEIAITLPTAAGNDSAESNAREIHIAVSSDGRFALNGRVLDRNQLAQALNQMSGSQPAQTNNADTNIRINIDADAKAPHQAVMTVLEVARDAGLANIAFSSQAKNSPNKK